MLDCVELTTGPNPTHSVIWLHGLGADGHDFEPIVPELVRQGSPLRDAIRAVPVPSPPAGYTVALCAKPRTLERRAMAAFWELASTRAETP